MATITIEERVKKIVGDKLERNFSQEEIEKIRNTPIDPAMAELLTPGAGIITEKVDFEPNQQILKNVRVIRKLGSGGEAHQYVVIITPDPKNDLTPVSDAGQPYNTRQHRLGLIEGKEKELMDTPDDIARNEVYDKAVIEPIKELLKKEIKYTRPMRNYADLRAIAQSPRFDLGALKFLSREKMKQDPLTEQEFRTEYDLLKRLSHKNIPQFIQFIETEEGIGYIVSHVDGKTIDQIIDPAEEWWRGSPRRNYLPIPVILAIMHQFYGAKAYMDRKGVLYQDIQQGNIMIGFDGLVDIIDFGHSEEILEGKKTMETSGTNEDFTSPEMMEHLEGGNRYAYKIKEGHKLPLHIKSGIWNAGVLTYVLLTDQYPFKGDSFARLQQDIMGRNPADPRIINPECPKDIVTALINGPLRKNPDQRPSASELERTTEHFLERYVGNKSAEDVLYEFMKPLDDIRTRAFVTPDVKSMESPRYTARRKGTRPVRP